MLRFTEYMSWHSNFKTFTGKLFRLQIIVIFILQLELFLGKTIQSIYNICKLHDQHMRYTNCYVSEIFTINRTVTIPRTIESESESLQK